MSRLASLHATSKTAGSIAQGAFWLLEDWRHKRGGAMSEEKSREEAGRRHRARRVALRYMECSAAIGEFAGDDCGHGLAYKSAAGEWGVALFVWRNSGVICSVVNG